jgi:hypothetical protein
MDEMLRFVGVMSALSASAQTLTHQLRNRFFWLQMEESKDSDGDGVNDGKWLEVKKGKLVANVHLVCGINGTILAAMTNLHPLSYLGLHPIWYQDHSPLLRNGVDYLVAGVLVAYGGPWFHETLGILREFKKSLREAK